MSKVNVFLCMTGCDKYEGKTIKHPGFEYGCFANEIIEQNFNLTEGKTEWPAEIIVVAYNPKTEHIDKLDHNGRSSVAITYNHDITNKYQ